LLSSHGNVRSTDAISNAQLYLANLAERVGAVGFSESLLKVPLEDVMPAGVEPSSFERIFHQRNLETVLERKLFTAPGSAY